MALKTTIVGCGAVAQRLYGKPLRELGQRGLISVVALVDRHRPNAEAMRSFCHGAMIHDDLEQSLKANPCDLTLVLSPSQHHAEHSILALRSGSHVLCEKPMATTEAECSEMASAARAMQRVLAIGMVRHFFPSLAKLRALIAQDEIGELRGFSYCEGKIFDWDVKTPAGFARHGRGGAGVFLDIGPHVIDALTWLMGTPQVRSYRDDALGGVEGNVQMDVDFPECSGTVQLSWDFPLKNELRILGSQGEAVLRVDQFDKLAVKKNSRFQEIEIDVRFPADLGQPARSTISPRLYPQSIYCQLIQVLRAIQLGESPAVDGEAGKECIAVIESARRCAQPIEMPWLDVEQQHAYRALHWTTV